MEFDPNSLPEISALRKRTKALAMLDAIICPEWEYRYYSFNPLWDTEEQMASMRNGQGDDWFILFFPAGAAIKGLDHESYTAQDELFARELKKQLPDTFSSFVNEPAFSMESASFCYWRGLEDKAWKKVTRVSTEPTTSSDDGSSWMLSLLVEPPHAYQGYAENYFEIDIPLKAINDIYAGKPLSLDIVKALNSNLEFSEAMSFAEEVAYP